LLSVLRKWQQALIALAHFFSISISELTGEIPLAPTIPESIKDSLKISTVPLIDWDYAKNWTEDQKALVQFDEIILERSINKNAFALQLQSSNMEPLFQEKSILIFDPSKTYKDRDFVLVYLKKTDSLIFNRLFVEGKNIYIKLDKNNGDADLIKLHLLEDKIIATLVEARLRF